MTADRRAIYQGKVEPSPEIKALADQMLALIKAGR